MRRKSTWTFGAQVTFGMIDTISPSKLFRNCSSLLWSLVILISNRWTLYFIFLPPSIDRFSFWFTLTKGSEMSGAGRGTLSHLRQNGRAILQAFGKGRNPCYRRQLQRLLRWQACLIIDSLLNNCGTGIYHPRAEASLLLQDCTHGSCQLRS